MRLPDLAIPASTVFANKVDVTIAARLTSWKGSWQSFHCLEREAAKAGSSATVSTDGCTPHLLAGLSSAGGGRSAMRRGHRGFTLVELLVVIAIIGVLVALLLPAVQAVRESARKVQCHNNLRQLGLAVQQFEQANRTLPPYFGAFPEKGTGAVEGGWFVHLLPYIEQQSITDAIIGNGGGLGQTRTLVQPASPDYSPGHYEYPPDGHWETTPGSASGTDYQGHTFSKAPSRVWVGPPPVWVAGTGTPPVYQYTN